VTGRTTNGTTGADELSAPGPGPTKRCPWCGGLNPLRQDGRVADHNHWGDGDEPFTPCPGSRTFPWLDE
jgi:hypothetical protein